MVGADERELHSWQNNQLSRRVSKAAGTRSTVSLRKPIFAIGFERASRYTVQREREREREIKDPRLLYSNSWKSFSYGQPPRSFPPILGTPLRTKPRRHTTLRPRELIRVPYFARLRRPSNINRQGRWRRQRRVLEPLDQEGGIPMERGLIAERKNWQQLRYRWLIDSELNP